MRAIALFVATAAVTTLLAQPDPLLAQVATLLVGEAPKPLPPPPTVHVGVTVGMGYFHDFENTIGEQRDPAVVTGEKVVPALGAFVEYTMPGAPLFGGLAVNYTSQDFTQSFQSDDPRTPVEQSGTVNGLTLMGYGGYCVPVSSAHMRLTGGLTYAHDAAEFRTRYLVGADEVNYRSLNTLKMNFGVGTALDLPGRVTVHGRAIWTSSFKELDADENVRVEAGISYGIPIRF